LRPSRYLVMIGAGEPAHRRYIPGRVRKCLNWVTGPSRQQTARAPVRIACAEAGKLPRAARLMALAIKLQGMVDRGEVRDYADLARLGYVALARIAQLMNLVNLAPDIQEAILFMPATTRGRDTVSERRVRNVTAIMSWP
jgi:hypothetical protein